MGLDPGRWLRDARRHMARLPSLRMRGAPDAPALPVRDPWPGDPGRGAALLKGELVASGSAASLLPGGGSDRSGGSGGFMLAGGSPALRAHAHGFAWLRDLRALGTDAARMRARALVGDWIAAAAADPLAARPDVAGSRITAWLGHYDFFAASADDEFRQRLMGRVVADARGLAALLPTEELDGRALTALKGVIAAAVALPEHAAFLGRALRVLPGELARQVLPDGSHCERSPAMLLAALQDLIEIRALLQSAGAAAPPALGLAIERMLPALRALRHGDGGLALFNGSKEMDPVLIDLVANQAGRAGRAATALAEGGFQRLQAGRTVLVVDCGAPAGPKLDRHAHAGTLAFELSVGRDRMIVNVGAAPAAGPEWRQATRATAAHSTLVLADTSSSELRDTGLGRRPEHVEVQRQEANGAHWLEASHDGWRRPFAAVHRRRLYLAESGEDVRGEDAVEVGQSPPVSRALSPSSHRRCQPAAGWRGGAAAPALWHRLAAARRGRAHDAGGKPVSGRGRAAPGRAGGADRLPGRRAACEMGDHEGRVAMDSDTILVWGAVAIGGTVGACFAHAGLDVASVSADPGHVATVAQRFRPKRPPSGQVMSGQVRARRPRQAARSAA